MRRAVWISVTAAVLTVLWFAGTALAQEPAAGGKSTPISVVEWFVYKGGPIGWLLIAIDIASWAIIIEHFFSIRRLNILPESVRERIRTFLDAKQYRDMIEYTSEEPSFLSYVVHQAVAEAPHGYASMERALEEATEERATRLLRKIELLNIIGNVSPMMGLLGTVYGMIRAFGEIVSEGGMPDASKLANSVGTALVTTFWGLIVAIPALAVYAVLRNRIDALSSEAMVTAQEYISTFRPGAKKAPGADQGESGGQ